MIKIISVVGARPNFIKIAPLNNAFKNYCGIKHLICHTGQHFDENMSGIFFQELGIPVPDFFLGISGGSHATQTAGIMIEIEKVLLNEKPDLVIVPGDVNSTMASAIVASKLGIPVAHIESGLRSFDRSMPEEINRIVTDALSDFLFVSERSGINNLIREGIPSEKIFFVGNIMIDSLINYLPIIEKSTILSRFVSDNEPYLLVTFHRPSNVDEPEKLTHLMELLLKLSSEIKVIFPVHPRTRKNISELKINNLYGLNKSKLLMTEPLGYIDFLRLVKNASAVITDSGGVQEETTFLGVQCITMRNNTERPVTVEVGTNRITGTNIEEVKKSVYEVLNGNIKKGSIPELWDGKTAQRIAKIITEKFSVAN